VVERRGATPAGITAARVVRPVEAEPYVAVESGGSCTTSTSGRRQPLTCRGANGLTPSNSGPSRPRNAESRLEGGSRARSLGGDLLSHPVSRAVPSALEGLTSGFGMGPGVSPPLWPPKRWFRRLGFRAVAGTGVRGRRTFVRACELLRRAPDELDSERERSEVKSSAY
jgi:hypothetical protein